MIDPMPYHIEVGGRLAAIYVVRRLSPSAADLLLHQCRLLPMRVEVLSLHAPQLDLLGAHAGEVVRQLRREWWETRRGPFRLTVSELEAPRGEAFLESALPL